MINAPAVLAEIPIAIEGGLVLAIVAIVVLSLLKTGRDLGRLKLYVVAGFIALLLVTFRFWQEDVLIRHEALQDYLETVPQPPRDSGYVSSDTCRSCHPSEYASWHRTYHRTMTQVASDETVLGNFDDVTLTYGGRRFELTQDGDEFWVRVEDINAPSNSDAAMVGRIGLLTGSHHMQAYWLSTGIGNMQMEFPFYWLKETQSWVPSGSTFLKDPEMEDHVPVWNEFCVRCHSTAGQSKPASLNDVYKTKVAELGIACEACHGPGDDHIRAMQNPARRYAQYGSDENDPTIVNPAKLDPKRASMICGKCHVIKYSPDTDDWKQHGYKFRPGDDLEETTPVLNPKDAKKDALVKELLGTDPKWLESHFWDDGMVRISGRDYNGLINSPCYKQGDLSCLSCHSMHHSDPADQLAAKMETNDACFQCHEDFRQDIPGHTHHAAGSSGSLCYNCHMPYTVYGLMKAIRSHQISVPTAQETQETGRPNACNLCHLDKTLEWTATTLNEWYDQPMPELTEEERTISMAVRQILTGDAGQRALIAWAMEWKSARQVSGEDWQAPYLSQLLVDPYAVVRFIAGRSLKSAPSFESFAYNYIAPESTREQIHADALSHWEQNNTMTSKSELLIKDGEVDRAPFEALLKRRDNRSMFLRE